MHATTADPKRTPGDLRAANRQDSIGAAVMAGPSISRIKKKYFFRPPVSVPLISLDQYRTERYSKGCMSRLVSKVTGRVSRHGGQKTPGSDRGHSYFLSPFPTSSVVLISGGPTLRGPMLLSIPVDGFLEPLIKPALRDFRASARGGNRRGGRETGLTRPRRPHLPPYRVWCRAARRKAGNGSPLFHRRATVGRKWRESTYFGDISWPGT